MQALRSGGRFPPAAVVTGPLVANNLYLRGTSVRS
jgi:hypothetical protein